MFDLDGTLLDTLDDLADAMNGALAAAGLPTHPTIADHKYMIGDGVRNYLLRALPEDRRGDDALIAAVTADYRARYAAGWAVKTRAYDGVTEMLGGFRGRGLTLTVLSNKPDETTRATVEHFLPADAFAVVRGATDGVPLKPDPAAALAIAEQIGIAPGEFLYVGDTATDMRTARSAGMYAAGALWGFRTADELTAAGADVLVESSIDLLEIA